MKQPPMQQQVPVQNNTNMIAIPVSNQEEANAFRVDLNGTPTFFYNAGKNEIYLKRTNTQTGAADFKTFQLVAEPPAEEKPIANVNAYENDFKALNDKIDSFNTKIDGLYSLLATVQVEPKSEQVKIVSAKWNVDTIVKLSGIDFEKTDFYEYDYAYVVNMLYSGYCEIFTDTTYYLKMAKMYLTDPDYPGKADERAYKNAMKRIEYYEHNKI